MTQFHKYDLKPSYVPRTHATIIRPIKLSKRQALLAEEMNQKKSNRGSDRVRGQGTILAGKQGTGILENSFQ